MGINKAIQYKVPYLRFGNAGAVVGGGFEIDFPPSGVQDSTFPSANIASHINVLSGEFLHTRMTVISSVVPFGS